MAKIIEHNFSRGGRQVFRDKLTGSFSHFVQEMEDKKLLLGEMVMQARLFLAKEGMTPGDFCLSESYVRDFYTTDLYEEGMYVEIVYLSLTDDRITALCQFASMEDGDVMISYQIYSLDGVSMGNKLWKVFNFETGRWIEDGEDCFDRSMILHDIGMFSSGQ